MHPLPGNASGFGGSVWLAGAQRGVRLGGLGGAAVGKAAGAVVTAAGAVVTAAGAVATAGVALWALGPDGGVAGAPVCPTGQPPNAMCRRGRSGGALRVPPRRRRSGGAHRVHPSRAPGYALRRRGVGLLLAAFSRSCIMGGFYRVP